MSFSFRNLFSEEAPENSVDPRRNGADAGGNGAHPAGSSSSAEAAFLVSELLPFVPPALSAKSGIPMEKEVILPLPADGSRDVKLSTLYQLCPELFAAEITPLNDSEVTLPPRIGAGGQQAEQRFGNSASSVGFSQPAQGETASFLLQGANHAGGPVEKNSVNPFWSADGEGEAGSFPNSPSTPPEQWPGQNGHTNGNGHANANGHANGKPGNPEPNGSSIPSSQPANKVTPGKQANPPTILPEPSQEEPHPSLHEQVPNNPFSFQPAKAEYTSPESEEVHPGVERGEIGVRMPESTPANSHTEETAPNVGELEPEEPYATLFSQKAEEDSTIPSPEVKLPPFSGKPSEMGTTNGQPGGGGVEAPENGLPSQQRSLDANDFNSPLNPHEPAKEEENYAEFLPPVGEADTGETTIADTPSIAIQAPQQAAALEGHRGIEEPRGDQEESAPQRSFFDELTQPTEPSSSNIGDSQKTQRQPTPSPLVPLAGSKSDSTVKEAEPQVGDARPEVEASAKPETQETKEMEMPVAVEEPMTGRGIAENEPKTIPQMPPSAPSIQPGTFSNANHDLFKHLELKAVFGTSENFTSQKVANLVCSLSGIASCAVFTPRKVSRASRDGMPQHEEGGPEVAKSVRELARMNGIEEANSFTLQTDTGMISLFLEGDSCLSVRHESGQFEPGVREKLILVARSLDQLDT